MRDILDQIERWREEGERVAIATVIRTWGSAPRPAGSAMAVTSGGRIAGSVSGGCVESAVVEAGQRSIASGRTERLSFGVADEKAWSVGLACGGSIDVFVEPLRPEAFDPVRDAIRSGRPVAIATVVAEETVVRRLVIAEDGRVTGSLRAGLDEEVVARAREAIRGGVAERMEPTVERSEEIFIDVSLSEPTLIVVGGVHIAIPLVAIAKMLRYRVMVIDPREAFARRERFPEADRVISEWPDRALEEIGIDRATAIAVLTHDPKIDDPALLASLRSPAFYVGALGSRRTHEMRRRRLLDGGLEEEALSRLHAPIGLPLGGRSPEEIALSIMAQVVAARSSSPIERSSSVL